MAFQRRPTLQPSRIPRYQRLAHIHQLLYCHGCLNCFPSKKLVFTDRRLCLTLTYCYIRPYVVHIMPTIGLYLCCVHPSAMSHDIIRTISSQYTVFINTRVCTIISLLTLAAHHVVLLKFYVHPRRLNISVHDVMAMHNNYAAIMRICRKTYFRV